MEDLRFEIGDLPKGCLAKPRLKGEAGEPVAVRGARSPAPLAMLSGEDRGAVGFGEFAPLAGGQIVGEMELADGYSEEAEGGKANGSGHFADLAVAAFAEGEFEPAGGDVLAVADRGIAGWKVGADLSGFGREGLAAFYDKAGAELLEGGIGDFAFDLGPVGAGVGVFRIEEFGVEAGFVGEQEEAFAVAVEAAEGVDTGGKTEFGKGALSGVVGGELGEDAERLVEG